jgi:hypothetical protein
MRKFLLVLLLFSVGAKILYAQALSYTSRQELLNGQLNSISVINNSVFNPEHDYLRGKLYYPPSNNINHPFFINNDWKSGKIWSSGKVFDLENIKYDINLDYLVYMYNTESTAYPVYLTREYVKEFIINDRHFKFLDDFDLISKEKYKSGYYEVLYDEDTKFYLRWGKSKEVRNSVTGSSYVQTISFLLKKDGKYISIKSQGGFISALEDRKKEIKSFMKTNSLRFSKNNYESVVKILNYYDNL